MLLFKIKELKDRDDAFLLFDNENKTFYCIWHVDEHICTHSFTVNSANERVYDEKYKGTYDYDAESEILTVEQPFADYDDDVAYIKYYNKVDKIELRDYPFKDDNSHTLFKKIESFLETQ